MWLAKKCSGALVVLAATHGDGDLLPPLRAARVTVLVRADERVGFDLLAVHLDAGEGVRGGGGGADGAPVALVGLTGALLREHGPPSPPSVDGLVHVEPVRTVDDLTSEVVEQDRAAAIGHHDVDLLDRVVEADCCVLLVELAVLVRGAVVRVARIGRRTAAARRAAAARAPARAAAARRTARAGRAAFALRQLVDDVAGLPRWALGVLTRVDAIRVPVLVDGAQAADIAAVELGALVDVAAGPAAAALACRSTRTARTGGRTAGTSHVAGSCGLVAVLGAADAADEGHEGDERNDDGLEGEGELVHHELAFLILGFGNVLIGERRMCVRLRFTDERLPHVISVKSGKEASHRDAVI